MLDVINDFLSSRVLIPFVLGLGAYFTIRSGFVQLRYFPHMFGVLRGSWRANGQHLSSLQALTLSLAGRVGTGNIVGVGIAVGLGGPGAVFWMWMTALLGMSSSFFECTLGQLYKRSDGNGLYRGGPSWYIQYGLNKRWLGLIVAMLMLVTFGFAINGLESHAVSHSLKDAFGLPPLWSGLALSLMLGIVFIGGITRIAAVADLLVPLKVLAYIGVTAYVLVLQFEQVPTMLMTIIRSAFGLDQAFGGLIGSAIIMGVRRGVFSNEAGLGSAPNVASVAKVSHPIAQGAVQALSVFIDTFVVCTCTALMILLSGIYSPGFEGDAIALAQNSLAAVVGDWGRSFISIVLALFVFTAMLYNYYLGENSLRFMFGEPKKMLIIYRLVVLVMVFWGANEDLSTVLAFADITMTLLALVNLIAMALLFKICLRLLNDYEAQRRSGIKTPVFDSKLFLELDLDPIAWPPAPVPKT
ncbi:sodium:alanine symporter [Pseudomonas sp. Choline-02u-1]|jgi:AGCS family alanine or glycine:cation symporter|uniref:alanine/glycine:cation symporter family protein n=1 Tax=unclassified Pseudomonas TaxID=196821 RepID=UPI000C34821C|nr:MULTISPECIES: alanine/glycine:cation symporter family protein [unclassified Pseudomonas]PKH83380.1 sodium:alanine symporter [Pseudomonas sp. Choline-02u-1]